MYGLVDCNNFYVSCERLFRPELINRPVIVLSNNDGCVISRSNEAKKLGVPMGIPAFQIRQLVEQENITVCSSNHALYGDLSRRVMRIIKDNIPRQEIYSIDECFVQVNNHGPEDLSRVGEEVRQRVLKGTGIPISIGFAPTKTLAKIANHIAKKQTQYNGVFILDDAKTTREILKQTPIDDVWGVGRRNVKKMIKYNIFNADDLTRRSARWIQENFTVVGLDTYYELKGVECIEFDENTPTKSIGRSRSFGEPISNKSDLYSIILEFAEIVCTSLQKKGLLANRVMVYLKTNRHNKKQPQYFPTAEIELGEPTDDLSELAPVVKSLLDKLYSPGHLFKKAGILVSDLEDVGGRMPFASEEQKKARSMQQLGKQFAEKYGKSAFFMAARDPSILETVIRKDQKTQNYTTNLQEVLRIKPTM